MSAVAFLAKSATDDPIFKEMIRHPNFRPIAAFFLGGAFVTSFRYASAWVYVLLLKVVERYSRFRHSRNINTEDGSLEKPRSLTTTTATTSLSDSGDNYTLIFTLSLCFLFASLAHFSTLLTFHASGDGAACAFVVAWGGMAAQTARLVGLVVLLLELRKLGISRQESIAFIFCLFVGLVFVFVNNATSTGSTSRFRRSPVSFCQKKYFLPISLASSLIYLVLELYVTIRLTRYIAPRFLHLRHQLAGMNDLRIWRALSLVLLEVLTIVPSAIKTNTLAEFLPFSIGAIAVLGAFNHRRGTDDTPRNSISVPRSLPVSGPGRSDLWRQTSRTNTVTPIPIPIVLPLRSPVADAQSNESSSKPQSSRPGSGEIWQDQQVSRTTRSSRTMDSESLWSAKGAVIQTVDRMDRPIRSRAVVFSAPVPALPREHLALLPQGTATRRIVESQDALAEQLTSTQTASEGTVTPTGLGVRPHPRVVTSLPIDAGTGEVESHPIVSRPPISALETSVNETEPTSRFSLPSTARFSSQASSDGRLSYQVTDYFGSPRSEASSQRSSRYREPPASAFRSKRVSRWPSLSDFPMVANRDSFQSANLSLPTVRGRIPAFPIPKIPRSTVSPNLVPSNELLPPIAAASSGETFMGLNVQAYSYL